MKQGERPDELVQHVKLPPPLAENPYLQEFYGGVEWTVRSIYADRLGWFDGNATNLFPVPEKNRAAKLVGLIGSPDQVLARGREALAASEFKWAAELANYVLANDAQTPARKGSRPRRSSSSELLPVLGYVSVEGSSTTLSFATDRYLFVS